MTHAPADLLAVREYLLTSTGLPADAVGIVGDPAHRGGYHCGSDRTDPDDYSRRESLRDRAGLSEAASALDIGDFRRGGVSLRSLTLGFVAACQRGDPRTRDVREVIYTPDGSTVRRFDRLGIRSTGDSSHLYHTHIGFFRDSEGRRAGADNALGLIRELIEGTSTGEDDDMGDSWTEPLTQGAPGYAGHQRDTALAFTWQHAATAAEGVAKLLAAATAEAARDAANIAAITALANAINAGGGSVDVMAVRAAVVDAVHDAVEPLQATIADLREQLADRDARLAAAYAAPVP